MDECIKTVKYKNFNINIYYDDEPENPREWDNLGNMMCWHKKYNLGDKNNFNSDSFNNWNEIQKHIKNELKGYIILPLRLYDHSGISISTCTSYPYNDRWDSGQVGFIYITKEKILKEYSNKIVSKKIREKVTQYLIDEVKIYDQYLRGEIYSYTTEDNAKNVINSCCGFYDQFELISCAHESIDCHVEQKKKEHFKKLKAQIKNRTPLSKRTALAIN